MKNNKLKFIMIIIVLTIIFSALFVSCSGKKEKVSYDHDPGTYFVTDIKGAKKLLKTDVILKVSDQTKQSELTTENHRIRDCIIFILRSKTEAELTSPDTEAKIKKEIMEKLNKEFETDVFVDVSFNEFVMQ